MSNKNCISKNQLEVAKAVAVESEIGNLNKGSFIAALSHELRIPLNSIMGMLQLLKDTELSPQQCGYINSASEASESLHLWINEITKFSTKEFNELTIESEPFDLFKAGNEVIKAFTEAALSKNINLQYQFVANTPTLVKGDVLKVQQVIAKLIENSINFTDKGSVTFIISYSKSENAKNKFIFKIIDTGIGMSKEKIERLFDFSNPLNRDEASVKRNSLELAVCNRIIAEMNGKIKVSSSEGSGTKFTVSIPLSEANPELLNCIVDESFNDNSEVSPKKIKSYAGLKVLLAEDDPINQSLAVAFLERLGAEVVTADNGKEVVEKFQEDSYNIIFMDCEMPILDGFKATRQIRKFEEGCDKHIPILAMTAYAGRGDKERCLASGMDGHIPKPITTGVLENIVKEFIL